MKLLYITNGITGAGGLERVLSVKASMLAEDFGYEVHILSLNEKVKKPFYDFSNKIIFHSIEVVGNPISYVSEYKRGIKNHVNKIKPEVISVCDDGLKGFFLPLILDKNIPIIHESHASYFLGNTGNGIPFRKKMEHHVKQILGKKFSKIILLTEGNRKEWNLQNISIIPNPAPFSTAEKSTLLNKKIIAVGSFSFNKGYDLLLKIWTNVAPEYPEWELSIYGKNTSQNLKSEAEILDLKNINFYEPVVNIEKKYLESSIFVLPSRSEGFGMVLIEAMSCSVPVISFDCPNGPKDIITNKEDGFLIENGNVNEFAKKLKSLMENENLRKKMGTKGKENAKRYEARKIVNIWDELFKNLTSQ